MKDQLSHYYNKIKCLFFGHIVIQKTCPFTKATLSSCSRCDLGSLQHSGQKFS